MKKELAWKIFKFFSVLLVIDFIALPIIGSLVDPDSDSCGNYGFFSCAALFLILPAIFGLTWIIFWWKTYTIAFMDDQWVKKWSKKFPILLPILIVFGKGSYNMESPVFAIRMFLIFCAALTFLFFYQLYQILKILLY